MAAHDVQREILEPMQRIYLPPRNYDEAQQSEALREYVSALSAFDATELNVAWSTVRDTHTTRAWPVPAAFVMAARQARKGMQLHPAPRRGASCDNERWETWKAVSRSALAYEAVKRNVAWALKCAILHDGKKPDQISLPELVSGKHHAEKTAGMIRRGELIPFKGRTLRFDDKQAATALRMLDAIASRETETQAEIRFSG